MVGTWLLVTTALPTRTDSFDFRHIALEDGLTLSFSRSSPPLAALEDEHIPLVPTYPALETVAANKSVFIGAGFGETEFWKRLKKYSRYAKTRINTKVVIEENADILPRRITNLFKVVKILPAKIRDSQQKPIDPNFNAQNSYSVNDFNSNQRAHFVENNSQTIRQIVEEPLRAPPVTRSLPTGEEKPPVILEKPENENVKHEENVSRVGPLHSNLLNTQTNKTQPPWTFAKQDTSSATANSSNPAKNPSIPARPDEKASVSKNENHTVSTAEIGLVYRIKGQVELVGGLAATGTSTMLNIQWKTGNNHRDGVIDYSTGEFEIDVPTLESGKIIATLVDDTKRAIGIGYFDLDGVGSNNDEVLRNVKIAIVPKESIIGGTVISAYSSDAITIPVVGGEVFAPSSVREAVNDDSVYQMSGLSSDSTFILDAYAPDHWGTRVISEGRAKSKIPLFPVKMLQSFFEIIGQSANNTELGVIWGEIKHRGKPVAGVSVSVSTADAIGPIYFNALRIPDKRQQITSENGLFAFIKVKPGLHVIMAQYQNKELPSVVASTSAGIVSYAEITFKKLQLKGVVFDPLAKKNVKAQVSVVGTSVMGQSGEGGFNLTVPSTDQVLFLEANAGPNYFISREGIARSTHGEIELYAVKKAWLEESLRESGIKMDAEEGLLLGFVKGPGFHVALDSEMNQPFDESNIFYFNAEGKIDLHLTDGIEGGGAFVMTKLKPGLHTLLATSPEGEMVTSRVFVSEPGVLNVMSLFLRP